MNPNDPNQPYGTPPQEEENLTNPQTEQPDTNYGPSQPEEAQTFAPTEETPVSEPAGAPDDASFQPTEPIVEQAPSTTPPPVGGEIAAPEAPAAPQDALGAQNAQPSYPEEPVAPAAAPVSSTEPAAVSTEPAPVAVAPLPPKKSRTPFIVVLILLVVVAAGVAGFLYWQSTQTAAPTVIDLNETSEVEAVPAEAEAEFPVLDEIDAENVQTETTPTGNDTVIDDGTTQPSDVDNTSGSTEPLAN